MRITVRETVTAGLLMAVSVMLSYPMFKIMGSIGFDALPAYLGAAAIGPVIGGIIGGVAHFLSAMLTGFPFTLPIHLVVTLTMFLACFAYGVARQRFNRYVAILVGILMNGPVSLFIAAYASLALGAPFAGMPMVLMLIGPLTLVSAINVILADVIYGIVGKRVANGSRA